MPRSESEYFQRNDAWGDYPLRAVGSILVDDHPLSDNPDLFEPGDKYIQVHTHIGDPQRIPPINEHGLPFREKSSPAADAVGPVLTMEEYEEILRTEAIDDSGRSVPLPPTAWIDYPDEPRLWAPRLHIVSEVETPVNEADHQIQATTIFTTKTPTGVTAYENATIVGQLQGKGFAPDSFKKIEDAVARQAMGNQAINAAGELLAMFGLKDYAPKLKADMTKLGDGMLTSGISDGKLNNIVRTSRHAGR